MNYKLVLSGVLAFLVVLFIFQNAQPVQVHFLFWTVEISRVVLMAIMLFAGMTISWLLGSWLRYRNRNRRKEGGGQGANAKDAGCSL